MLHARAALVPSLSRQSCRGAEALSSRSKRHNNNNENNNAMGKKSAGSSKAAPASTSAAVNVQSVPSPLVTEGLGPVPACLRVTSAGSVSIAVHAKPGSKQATISNVEGPSVGIAIDAPAREGDANDALVEFMAEVLKLKKRQVFLKSGSKSREKVVVAEGCTIHEVHRALVAAQGK